ACRLSALASRGKPLVRHINAEHLADFAEFVLVKEVPQHATGIGDDAGVDTGGFLLDARCRGAERFQFGDEVANALGVFPFESLKCLLDWDELGFEGGDLLGSPSD